MSETPPLVSGGQEIRRSGGQETPPLVSGGFVEVPPPHVPFGGSSDYMRMLREAQGVTSTVTSCRTSCRVSPLMSSHHSPKSPPNSPNNERSEYYGGDTDLSGVYINTLREPGLPREEMADFIWDWSSRPNILPPKQWKLQGCVPSKSPVSSPREGGAKEKGLSTTKVVFTFLITNVISLIIGAGIGMWIKRNIVKSEL